MIPNSVLTPDLYVNSLTGAGNVNLAAAGMYVGADNTNQTYSGNISGSFGGVTKMGTGVQTLSGVNTYAGATTIMSGVLQLGSAGAIPSGAGVGNVSVLGTLDVNGQNASINGLERWRHGRSAPPARATLTVGNNNASSQFSGVIQNTGGSPLGLVKTGTGTLTLSGTMNHSGPTVVNNGTLVAAAFAGPSAIGPTTVNNNATLSTGSAILANLSCAGQPVHS